MQSFLGQVVREIAATGALHLRTHPDSAKDYISIYAVGHAVQELIASDAAGIVNVCNGYNLTHRDWLEQLRKRFDAPQPNEAEP